MIAGRPCRRPCPEAAALVDRRRKIEAQVRAVEKVQETARETARTTAAQLMAVPDSTPAGWLACCPMRAPPALALLASCSVASAHSVTPTASPRTVVKQATSPRTDWGS